MCTVFLIVWGGKIAAALLCTVCNFHLKHTQTHTHKYMLEMFYAHLWSVVENCYFLIIWTFMVEMS